MCVGRGYKEFQVLVYVFLKCPSHWTWGCDYGSGWVVVSFVGLDGNAHSGHGVLFGMELSVLRDHQSEFAVARRVGFPSVE